MARAGIYTERLTWLRRSVSRVEQTGQEVESFTSAGRLWCGVEEVASAEGDDEGVRTSRVDVKIRVRNQPGLCTTDRLRDGDTVYQIDGIVKADDELVVTAHGLRCGAATPAAEIVPSGFIEVD